MNPINIPVAELKPALTGLSKLISSKAPPPLQCVKVDRTTEGWIALTTTDRDHFITVRLEQPTPGKPVSMLVPFDALANLVKNANRGDSLEVAPDPEGLGVLIICNKAASASSKPIKSPPVADFPATPRIASDPVPLPPAVRHAIHEAMACTSDDPTRLILHGAFIDVLDPKAHYVVSTDGKHLYSSNSFDLPLKSSVLIPKHKFLGWKEFNNDGEWQLKVSDGKFIQLNSRRWRFISRQLEGNYPRWRAVLPDPQQAKAHVTIDPATLEALIQTIEKLPCHNEKYRTIGLELKDKRLHLLAKAEEDDPWTGVPVKVIKAEGKDTTIFLDRYLLRKALQFGLNTLSVIDEVSPLRFSRDGRQLIVMPLRPECVHPRNPTPVPRRHAPVPPPPPMQPSPQPPPSSDHPHTLDTVIEAVHQVRESFISGVNRLRELGLQLRHLQREHKSSSRELNSVRSTLRSLQSLKI